MRFVDLETAKDMSGLRLVVIGQLPSPWSEAAKGLFRTKGIDFVCVRLKLRDPAFEAWTRSHNAPVALFDGEWPRSSWTDIVALAERLGGKVSLVPRDASDRAWMFGRSHEVMGEQGLAWCVRLLLIEASLATDGAKGFPLQVARYLVRKYGGEPGSGAAARERIDQVLRLLATQLEKGRARGGPYFFGEHPSVLDIYAATASVAFAPFAAELCPMAPELRKAFEWVGAELSGSVPPALLEHRDLVFRRHLGLPIQL